MSPRGDGRGKWAGKVSAGNLGGGGGLNIFFGAEMPAKTVKPEILDKYR